MMGGQARLDETQVMRIAEQVGLDVEKLKADMNAPDVDLHLARSTELARALGFNGTPSFVVGDQLSYGALSASEMAEMLAAQRADSDG
jgi:2-hydroxychromene-2-carboxylate isomerase